MFKTDSIHLKVNWCIIGRFTDNNPLIDFLEAFKEKVGKDLTFTISRFNYISSRFCKYCRRNNKPIYFRPQNYGWEKIFLTKNGFTFSLLMYIYMLRMIIQRKRYSIFVTKFDFLLLFLLLLFAIFNSFLVFNFELNLMSSHNDCRE